MSIFLPHGIMDSCSNTNPSYSPLPKFIFIVNNIYNRMYQVVDARKIDREVVAVAWNLCDRYISSQTGETLSQPNTLGVMLITCFFLAIKTKAPEYARGSQADDLVEALCNLVGQGTYAPNDVFEMEKNICRTLNWRLNAPTMHEFVASYVALHPVGSMGLGIRDHVISQYLLDVCRYQVEGALFKQELMLNYNPSIIAMAAVLRAEDTLVENNNLHSNMTESHSHVLHRELKLNPMHVEEAKFALENYTARIPSLSEYEADLRIEVAAPFGNDPPQREILQIARWEQLDKSV